MKIRGIRLLMSIALLLIVTALIHAQMDEVDDNPIQFEEITVITHLEKDTFRTPNAISVIDRSQIERINAPTTPRILRETVGVWAQQTTSGQGSPLLRGLTGYQAFLSIDGVRLNNSHLPLRSQPVFGNNESGQSRPDRGVAGARFDAVRQRRHGRRNQHVYQRSNS